ncbi:hypothetical protein [Rhizobium sp. 18055]|jgi:hypothetical protein|nr:hypothetical protein [Rhizobium sp. 18055]
MPDLRHFISQKCLADVIGMSFSPTISAVNKIGMGSPGAAAD